jgi:hypothetical protein
VIYALSIDSGPGTKSVALALSLAQQLMAKERATCG